jgi:N-acyl amino acid synthase FeeM
MVGAQVVSGRRWRDADELVASLDFGLATETRDFEGAFRLLHDQYVRIGYMHPHPSRRRVTIFNALPSTKVFVARDRGRVVGTVTLVQDSPLGLPMDQVYQDELSAFRASGRRLGEASTLSVDADYQESGVGILMRLYRMLTVYATTIARLHDLCMVVRGHHARFYQTFFPFRPIGPTRPYPRLEGAPVVGFRADLTRIQGLIHEARAGLVPGSPFDFFFGPEHYGGVMARLHRDLAASAMSPEQVAHFFEGPDAERALAIGRSSPARRAAISNPLPLRRVHQLTA